VPTIHAFVASARHQLCSAGIADVEADLDARLLAERLLGWDTAAFFTHAGDVAPPDFVNRYPLLIERRRNREPIAYISGVQEFWGLSFEVSPAVLIPRPETELIVELFIEQREHLAQRHGAIRVADACTGSGCLAVAIAHEHAAAQIVATDISAEALDVARRNADRHGVSDRIAFCQADVLLGIAGDFDAIVANPPYIPDEAIAALQPEVRDHEPRVALAAGPDGLDVLRSLVTQSVDKLKPSGLLLFEFGFGQADAVRDMVRQTAGLTMVGLRNDLQGIARTAIVERTGARR
jgi:release factor glutamine methyltransferase